jgi:hypothetical protein
VPTEVNRCYFFNPFSVEILRKVMAKIIESYYLEPREILLFFYYPSEEYILFLMTIDELEFYDEIDCRDLFDEDNQRERITIFQINKRFNHSPPIIYNRCNHCRFVMITSNITF